MGFKKPFGLILVQLWKGLGRIWEDLGKIKNNFWKDFGKIWGRIWMKIQEVKKSWGRVSQYDPLAASAKRHNNDGTGAYPGSVLEIAEVEDHDPTLTAVPGSPIQGRSATLCASE